MQSKLSRHARLPSKPAQCPLHIWSIWTVISCTARARFYTCPSADFDFCLNASWPILTLWVCQLTQTPVTSSSAIFNIWSICAIHTTLVPEHLHIDADMLSNMLHFMLNETGCLIFTTNFVILCTTIISSFSSLMIWRWQKFIASFSLHTARSSCCLSNSATTAGKMQSPTLNHQCTMWLQTHSKARLWRIFITGWMFVTDVTDQASLVFSTDLPVSSMSTLWTSSLWTVHWLYRHRINVLLV